MSPAQRQALQTLWETADGRAQCTTLAAGLSVGVRELLGVWRIADREHSLAYRALARSELHSERRELAMLNEEITRRRLLEVEHELSGAVRTLLGL